MPKPVSSWSWHRLSGIIISIPLVWMCVTGVLYEISLLFSLTEYGISHGWVRAKWLLRLHQMSVLGSPAIYTAILGTAVVVQSVIGLQRLSKVERRPSRWFYSMHKFHGIAGFLLATLGTYTAVTGAAYRTLRAWSSIPKQDLKWLLGLHHGHLLFGPNLLSLLYIGFIGLACCGAVYSGIAIVSRERTPVANRGAGILGALFPKKKLKKSNEPVEFEPLVSPT